MITIPLPMTVVPLPLDMAKQCYINPWTFETVYTEHLILDVGSSYGSLKKEITDWLHDNHIRYNLQVRKNYELAFESEQDAIAFKLRCM